MWICPVCQRKLGNTNQWHNCVKVSIGSLFENKNPVLTVIYEKLLTGIKEWQGVSFSATKNCIVFIRSKTFLVVRPMKKELDLKFYLPYYSQEFPIYKSVEYAGKYATHIRLSDLDDLDHSVLRLLKISFNLQHFA